VRNRNSTRSAKRKLYARKQAVETAIEIEKCKRVAPELTASLGAKRKQMLSLNAELDKIAGELRSLHLPRNTLAAQGSDGGRLSLEKQRQKVNQLEASIEEKTFAKDELYKQTMKLEREVFDLDAAIQSKKNLAR
jgi:hypothetical protein